MKQKRYPKHMGTGIYVHQQFRPSELVKGDTFMDADYGDMVWDGRKWIHEEDYSAKQWDNIHRAWKRHTHSPRVIIRYSLIDFLKQYYLHPKKIR